ncbi:MAG: chalcone isomerase family protein [Desulfovermiculus sp.]
MNKFILVMAACLLMTGGNARAGEVKGVHIPESLSAGDVQLKLNGAGVRNKFFLKGDVFDFVYRPEKGIQDDNGDTRDSSRASSAPCSV